MKNSPYLDRPFIPLAVSLCSMLAETEAKIATAAPAEKTGLPKESRGAAPVGYTEINNPALGLAAYRAVGPGLTRGDFSLRSLFHFRPDASVSLTATRFRAVRRFSGNKPSPVVCSTW